MALMDENMHPARAVAPANPHVTDEAKQRVRARNRANSRMKWYGIAAIAFAGFALVALLNTVFQRAAAVVTEHYAVLDVTVPEGDVADVAPLLNQAIVTEFPSLSASVKGEKKDGEVDARLFFLSEGAADDLIADLENDAVQSGSNQRRLLISDDAELYLEGEFGAAASTRVAGTLTIEARDRRFALSSTANDFSAAVDAIKLGLRKEIISLEEEAPRFRDAVAKDAAVIDDLKGRLVELGADPDADPPELDDDEEEEAPEETQIRFMLFEKLELQERMAYNNSRQKRLFDKIEALQAVIDAPSLTKPLKFGAKDPSFLVNVNGGTLKLLEVTNDTATAAPLVRMDALDEAQPGAWSMLALPSESLRNFSDAEIAMVESLRSDGRIETGLSWRFFSNGDSKQPEIAGIKAALIGSFLTLAITFALAFPIAVLAAIYLEEFAGKNMFTDFIEVNINNLAAVPSIVFGLLGLAVLTFVVQSLQLNIVRGAPLIGGFVLALMTLPTIIIAARAAIRAVPPSIRSAALGLGASKVQTVFHHVLPLAMPGILTGTIIGMAQALGETAPLLLIGMVAFITAAPDCWSGANCITETPATVLPVQVFQWAGESERAFDGRTAAAIVVLLVFLVVMNAIAIFLRKRFERRW